MLLKVLLIGGSVCIGNGITGLEGKSTSWVVSDKCYSDGASLVTSS